MQSLKIFTFISFENNVRFEEESISSKYILFSYAMKDLTTNEQKIMSGSEFFRKNIQGLKITKYFQSWSH